MVALERVLKFCAPIFLLVGALHLAIGLQADVLLGAQLPADVIANPALDSQNRFYGVAFALYGVLLWLCATDIVKYAQVLRCVLWVFFAAGIARLVSVAIHGLPPPLVLALLCSELILPPVLVLWLNRVVRPTISGR
jgi:hypothetical protein